MHMFGVEVIVVPAERVYGRDSLTEARADGARVVLLSDALAESDRRRVVARAAVRLFGSQETAERPQVQFRLTGG